MPRSYTTTPAQRAELESLAYWIADRAWIRERGKLDEYEDRRTNTTIRAIFDRLDRLSGGLAAHNARGSAGRDARPVNNLITFTGGRQRPLFYAPVICHLFARVSALRVPMVSCTTPTHKAATRAF